MFPLKPHNLKPPKNRVPKQEAHTAPYRFGMGDHYGTGHKNPMGRMRDGSVGYRPVTAGRMRKPPKSVV